MIIQRRKEKNIMLVAFIIFILFLCMAIYVIRDFDSHSGMIDPKACPSEQNMKRCEDYCKQYPNSQDCTWYVAHE